MWLPDSHREAEQRERQHEQWEWSFDGPCPNCGHDSSFHDWGGGGMMSNVSVMYCKAERCDCGYYDGQDSPDDPVGWTGGKGGR